MRAVYVAIFLGFFRRLLGKMLEPAGGLRKTRWYELQLCEPGISTDESMYIDKVVVGGPYYIPGAELVKARYTVRVSASHLPGDLYLSLAEIDKPCMVCDLCAAAVRYGFTEEELHCVVDARTFLSRYI